MDFLSFQLVIGGSMSKYTLPIIQLFKSESRRGLLRFALQEADPDIWYTKSDLADIVGYSTESIRKNVGARESGTEEFRPGPLIEFGVFDFKDSNAPIPHYRVADTEVMEMLNVFPGDINTLFELMGLTARQKLVDFFLDHAESGTSYSKNELSKQSEASYQGVQRNIDYLVDVGIVEEVEGTRATEYQRNEDSELLKYLEVLNGLLVETFYERTDS